MWKRETVDMIYFSKDLHSFELYVCALSVYGLVHMNIGTESRRGWMASSWSWDLCWELNSCPLEGLSMLLTTQPSLALHVFKVVFWKHAHVNLVSQIH